MTENLSLYEKVREVPADALKAITGGRLKGKSDINPMWRIKKLTEEFGPCGVGWYPEVIKQWIEPGANGEFAAFCNINLYVKVNGEWSKPIFGTGGSMFVANEKSGPFTSDECYKMALTDAISVSCKELGFGADVYWGADKTKYDRNFDPDKSQYQPNVYAPQEWQEESKQAYAEVIARVPDPQIRDAASMKNYGKKFADLGEIEIIQVLKNVRAKEAK